MCVNMYIWGRHTCRHINVEARGQPWVWFCRNAIILPSRQGLSLAWDSPSSKIVGQQGPEVWFHFPSTRITSAYPPMSGIFTWVLSIKIRFFYLQSKCLADWTTATLELSQLVIFYFQFTKQKAAVQKEVTYPEPTTSWGVQSAGSDLAFNYSECKPCHFWGHWNECVFFNSQSGSWVSTASEG